jgi:hypothetical protein
MILVEERVQVSPAGLTLDVSATVPVNAFTGAMVMMEVPVVPELIPIVVGLALTLKSAIA